MENKYKYNKIIKDNILISKKNEELFNTMCNIENKLKWLLFKKYMVNKYPGIESTI